jgi:hypothetical protein
VNINSNHHHYDHWLSQKINGSRLVNRIINSTRSITSLSRSGVDENDLSSFGFLRLHLVAEHAFPSAGRNYLWALETGRNSADSWGPPTKRSRPLDGTSLLLIVRRHLNRYATKQGEGTGRQGSACHKTRGSARFPFDSGHYRAGKEENGFLFFRNHS